MARHQGRPARIGAGQGVKALQRGRKGIAKLGDELIICASGPLLRASMRSGRLAARWPRPEQPSAQDSSRSLVSVACWVSHQPRDRTRPTTRHVTSKTGADSRPTTSAAAR